MWTLRGACQMKRPVTAGVHGAQPAGRREEGARLACVPAPVRGLHAGGPPGRGAVNQVVTGETGTTVVLAGLTVFNAVVGLRQESKAEESVKALAQMMKTIARVRRGGQAVEIDAENLVPGDVVLVEAGNRVPADGRVIWPRRWRSRRRR